MSIKVGDLPPNKESLEAWLDDLVSTRDLKRTELGSVAVSAQLIAAELLEEIELMSKEINSSVVPSIRKELEVMVAELGSATGNAAADRSTPEPMDCSLADHLRKNLARMNDVSRARQNIDLVKERLLNS
jgi:hypothetical protein